MFCKQCGNKIEDTSLAKCPKCNTGIGKGGRFCENCGSKLIKGTPCPCTIKKEEAKPVIKADLPAQSKEKEDKEPEILKNERVRNNPLFARIAAQEENTDVEEVICNEAYKIAKKENLISDIDLVEKSEEEPKLSEEISVSEEPEISKADNNQVKKSVSIPKKNKKEIIRNEKPILPKLTPEEVKPPATNNIITAPSTKEEKNNKEEKVNSLFPDTFNYKPPAVQPVTASPVKMQKKDKKSFDFCSNAASLILIFAFFFGKSSVLAFCLLAIVSLILGIVDMTVNEKKTGLGTIIASVFTMAYILIQKFLF